jgi:hypothetical protein
MGTGRGKKRAPERGLLGARSDRAHEILALGKPQNERRPESRPSRRADQVMGLGALNALWKALSRPAALSAISSIPKTNRSV